MAHQVPDFDHLPEVKGMPQGCAWGLWDKDGKKDVWGTLNLLTPDVIKAAYAELQEGVSVSLNWPINAIKKPGWGRKGLKHKVIDFRDRPHVVHGYDDEIEFNTQCSSQWDSLCHYHHQPSASGYNGVQTNAAQLTFPNGEQDSEMKFPTLNQWHKRGGLVARGILIDAKRYFDAQGRKFDPFNDDKISIEDIETIAQAQGLELKFGDVIIIRTGFTEMLFGQSEEEQNRLLNTRKACGVTSTDEAAKWFWNKHFAAVASDTIAFEHIPPAYEGGRPVYGLKLHQYFLSLFGMSIGELWDLKELSETCAHLNKYSFLLTSSPLNYPGSVGSPPNALALF